MKPCHIDRYCKSFSQYDHFFPFFKLISKLEPSALDWSLGLLGAHDDVSGEVEVSEVDNLNMQHPLNVTS